MDVGARAATTADLSAVVFLAETAIDELRPNRGGELWYRQTARHDPVATSIGADMIDDEAHVVVGTIDDTVVGYGVLRVDVLRLGEHLGVVTDLFTLEGARGVGIGEAMMNHLLERAAASGCMGVDSLALPGDRHTKNFFESFGLVARAIVVHRSLEPAAEPSEP